MLVEHPKLQGRLNQVLGGSCTGRVSFQYLKIYARHATVEVKVSFDEGNIPPNFRKKSRNCLVFFLEISDFELNVRLSDEVGPSAEVQFIKSDEVMFYIGRYQYKISSNMICIGEMQSVSEMDLIDEIW